MFTHLQIDDPIERRLVGLADVTLRVMTAPNRMRRVPRPAEVSTILVFRLERVGDLLMARPGLRLLRRRFPEATIHLVVGSWNEALARLIPDVDEVQTLDLPWASRERASATTRSTWAHIRRWRARRYDLAVNCEGDIRSHLLMRGSGAICRAGFDHAGGGPLLTTRVAYDPTRHVAWNILRLVARLRGEEPDEQDLETPPLSIPETAARLARETLVFPVSVERIIGVHPGAGRVVKQWPAAAFASAAAALARKHRAGIVLTGNSSEVALAGAVRAALPRDVPVLDLTGRLDLVQLAAVLQRLDLFLGCDSGPMHLAAAVGTPVVAVFGPSSPARWGPLGSRAEVVRVSLPCSPCNRIRRPPERCRNGVPECLESVRAANVIAAAERVLARQATGGDRARA